MGLEQYLAKRRFERTPEPRGGGAGGAMYVIQKHAARRLHYDLRLELNGVLKSWAVPGGPSLKPLVKRLAVHVEDHPIEYGAFEGTIPEGEYGGGTVMVWDRGTWEAEGDPEKGYARGDLKFRLHGERLKGKWALVRMKSGEEGKDWLLIKKKDSESLGKDSEEPAEKFDSSVASARTMDEIALQSEKIESEKIRQGEEQPPDAEKDPGAIKNVKKKAGSVKSAIDPSKIKGARRTELPEFISPELATLSQGPPGGENWIHEVKYDGYRMECIVSGGRVRLISRNGREWTDRFLDIARAAAELPVESAIFDGEVVVFDREGRTDFQALQNIMQGMGKGSLSYVVFDIVFCGGFDLTRSPLSRRKELLGCILRSGNGSTIRLSDHIAGDGETVFQKACGLGLEGIVSKQEASPYEQKRSRRWLKVKCGKRQEFVIGGFTEPGGSRSGFGALLLGYYDAGGDLIYCGKVGTGFDDRMLASLSGRLKSMEISRPAFANPPTGNEARGSRWIRPELTAEVVFGAWTEDGRLRQAAFKGFREDKKPREVVREEAGSPKRENSTNPAVNREGVKKHGSVKVTNPDREFFPDIGVTKKDLIDYYTDIADWILPHLRRRPLTLVRCPGGLGNACFFQKHFDESAPPVLFPVTIPGKNGEEIYSVLDTIEGVIALVQMGALEIHAWGSRDDRLEQPDLMIFDLDPAQDVPWAKMINAAFFLRDKLLALGLKSFVKTTGGKGLHIAVPLKPKVDWDGVKEFSRAVSEIIVKDSPRDFIATMSKAKRKGKIFIDYLRNGRGATSVAPYSTRAGADCTVSTPLAWEELSEKIKSDSYNIGNIRARLAGLKDDPWKGYFSIRQSITAAMRKKVGRA
ncbi:MAG: DNA ligase D [Syntrophobacteraceae bacterium]|nr:DNA ligase D [Syntrophobacteraceae bacterium]